MWTNKYLRHDIELKPKGHIHFSCQTGGRKHKGLCISSLSFPISHFPMSFPIPHPFPMSIMSSIPQDTLLCSPCACLALQHYLHLWAKFPYVYLSYYLPVRLKHSHTHCLLSKRQFLASVHKTQPATHHRYTQMTKWLKTAAFSSIKTLSEISMTVLVWSPPLCSNFHFIKWRHQSSFFLSYCLCYFSSQFYMWLLQSMLQLQNRI